MNTVTALPGALVDAFVDVIAPVFGRKQSRTRIVAEAQEDGGEVLLFRVDGTRAVALGPAGALDARARRKLGRAGTPVELRLPPGRTMTRTVRIPVAGRTYAEAIVSHRLERLTPWPAEDVLFGYILAGEADADGHVNTEIVATSRTIAAPAEAALAAAGLTATALGQTDGPPQTPLRVDLYRGTRSRSRQAMRRTVFGIFLVAIALLAPAALVSWLFLSNATAQLDATEATLADLRRAMIARTGRDQAGGRAQGLIAKKTPERAVITLVADLSGRIPDNTVLTDLELTEGVLRLRGTSADAPGMIGFLDASPRLASVAFAAPVVRDGEGRDRFDISATLAPDEATQ